MTTDFGRHSALSPAAPVEPASGLAAARINHGRTLAQVLAELMLAEADLKRLDASIGDDDPTELEDARWSRLTDTIWLRRDEAKAMIEALTGVSWSSIEGANL